MKNIQLVLVLFRIDSIVTEILSTKYTRAKFTFIYFFTSIYSRFERFPLRTPLVSPVEKIAKELTRNPPWIVSRLSFKK